MSLFHPTPTLSDRLAALRALAEKAPSHHPEKYGTKPVERSKVTTLEAWQARYGGRRTA